MKNTIICAAGCDAKEGTEQEEATARTLCMDALDVIIGTGEQRQGVGIAANAVEKFHDLESVSQRQSSCSKYLGKINK